MRVIDCGGQGSGPWLHARCGRITASRMADVLAYTKKGEETARRADYRVELVSERLTGLAVDKYVSYAMKEGTRLEPEARTAYELATDTMLDKVGFVLHPEMDFSGASPDGLSEGGVEIKCPTRTTHLEYLLAGVVPAEYEPQMVWNMVCCEREWWDFVSYNPDFPDPFQLFVVRLLRNDKRVEEIEREVRKMHAEVDATIEKLKNPVTMLDQLKEMAA